MDQLRIKCPSLTCRKILAVPASSRGKNVRCKNCGATIRVPAKQGPMPKSIEEPKSDSTKAA